MELPGVRRLYKRYGRYLDHFSTPRSRKDTYSQTDCHNQSACYILIQNMYIASICDPQIC